MLSKVKTALENLNIVKDSKIAVAFSGGCDSSALLDCLVKLSERLSLTLCAVHIDHSLRGAESDRDAAFAATACEGYGIKLHTFKVDVAGESALTGESTELCARRLRYAVFDQFVSDGWLIATAHTASDNVETVLFNLARGSGITGLCGIPRRRGGYIRPLLDCTREDTEQYCAANSVPYVNDSSNLTDDYTRNFIRHRIMPLIKQLNPSAELAVINTSDQLHDIDLLLNDMANSALDAATAKGGYDCKVLTQNEPAVLSRAVRIAAQRATGKSPDSEKTKRICKVVAKGSRTQLYDGWYASGGRLLQFYRDKTPLDKEVELSAGTFIFGDKPIECKKTQYVNNLLMQNAIDCDKIIGKAVIRSRQSGDAVKLAGRPRKLLRRLMNELEIPAGHRDSYPVIADAQGVIFVPGAGAAERVKVDNKTKDVFIITLLGGE